MNMHAHIDWRQLRDDLDRRLANPHTSFADDAERSATILRERSACLALVPVHRERRDAAHFLIFTSGGARFGLPLLALREVVPLTRLARVPGAPPAVRGVMSWRGEFVTVFDVAPILGLAAAGDAAANAVVFRGETPLIALAFERAEGVDRFEIETLRSAGEWQSATPALFRGATAEAVALFDGARLAARLRADLRPD